MQVMRRKAIGGRPVRGPGIPALFGGLVTACLFGCTPSPPTSLYVETLTAGPALDRAHDIARAWAAGFGSGEGPAAIDSHLTRYRVVKLDRDAARRFFSLAEANKRSRPERFELSVFADAPCTLSGRTTRTDFVDGRLLVRTACEEDERWAVAAVLDEADGSISFSFGNRCASDNSRYASVTLENTGYDLAYEWRIAIRPGLPRVILDDGPCG